MTGVPLNVFQRTQRLWDTAHPYNAAQLAQLTTSLSADAVQAAFDETIAALRLGLFAVAGGKLRIEPSAPRSTVTDVAALDDHLTAEMNRPFDAGALPLRPFVARDAGGDWVGVVYQHWVADSVAVRFFMKHWVHRLVGSPLPPEAVTLEAGGLLRRFGPEAGGWSVLSTVAETIGFAATMKRMRRVEPAADQSVRVRTSFASPGLIDALLARARRANATVGDVFLAAAADVCHRFGPGVATKRRPDLALGTIVDLRARHPRLPDSVFGLYLGFLISPFDAASLRSFEDAVARARQLRLAQAARKSAEASQLRMGLGLLLAGRLSPRKRLEFYRKRLPLAGGLSNLNLTPGWVGRLHPNRVTAYHRVSPTGPMMPLVFTPTTLGSTLSLCCTTKTALLDDTAADTIRSAFLDRLRAFAG